MPVDTPRKDYLALGEKWSRLRDCAGGRDAVLAAGKKYVPELNGADSDANSAYRQRGSFYNAVSRTVQGMNGMIFQAPPKVEIEKTFEEYLKDITLNNISFEMFSVEAGKEVMLVARYGVLVDMPATLATDSRPYLCGYLAENIINWKTERRGADDVLTMVILREFVEVPKEDDIYCSDTVCQIRVVWLDGLVCKQQKYRPKKDALAGARAEYEPYEGEAIVMRRGVALDFVPFVFIGQTNASPEPQCPVLIDLADVNLAHWRNSVDYEYGLHLVALPTPWVSGPKTQAEGTKMRIGPSVVWELEPQGSAGMLEFTGAGLESIVVAMEEKKKQMATLGARLLEDVSMTPETATAVRMRHSGETASLKTIAGSLEQGLTLALRILVWWAGTGTKPKDDDKTKVELNKEYLNVKASPQEVQTALTALQAGEISFETWWHILSTGGWTPDDVSSEDEKKLIAERKAEQPDPVVDPELSPDEPNPNAPKKKVIKDATGKVKYQIEEN